MSIRLAQSRDAIEIGNVASALGYPANHGTEAVDRLAAILDSGSDKVWVYKRDKKVVAWLHAFVALRLASSAFVEIGGLVVEPDYRHQGIGRELVQQAHDWAASQQLKLRVRCHSQREDSHRFYLAAGFQQTKSQHIFELE